ncbi:hypothetical protein A0128_02275 [Leptospira tipperaryensis]|uniref:Uncharacterized protein n=1 Tax=Leptospira tipperaryensis TaxID=2564040 RepID=A0A1D7UT64_9LEPT|nr:hypothetical protein A0128_02275 [Leptospira tipperaryensis]
MAFIHWKHAFKKAFHIKQKISIFLKKILLISDECSLIFFDSKLPGFYNVISDQPGRDVVGSRFFPDLLTLCK